MSDDNKTLWIHAEITAANYKECPEQRTSCLSINLLVSVDHQPEMYLVNIKTVLWPFALVSTSFFTFSRYTHMVDFFSRTFHEQDIDLISKFKSELIYHLWMFSICNMVHPEGIKVITKNKKAFK